MGSEFTFYDYVDADGSGENIINGWLNGGGRPVKAHFAMVIRHLEESPPANWPSQYTKPMKHEWGGFRELRKTGRVQYRLIGKIVQRKVLLVASGIHKDQYYITDVTPQVAAARVRQMISDPRYRREHDYN